MSWPSATVQGVEGGLQDEMALGQDVYALAQRNCRGRRGVGTTVMSWPSAIVRVGRGGIERNMGRRCEQKTP